MIEITYENTFTLEGLLETQALDALRAAFSAEFPIDDHDYPERYCHIHAPSAHHVQITLRHDQFLSTADLATLILQAAPDAHGTLTRTFPYAEIQEYRHFPEDLRFADQIARIFEYDLMPQTIPSQTISVPAPHQA